MYFSQHSYRCKLEWGRDGARRGAERGDILVIVDTLSFSTATITAVDRGAIIYPSAEKGSVAELARSIGGYAAVGRSEVPDHGRFSLSPITLLDAEPGMKIVLWSPNGAVCSRLARHAERLLIGAPVNARAASAVAAGLIEETGRDVTIVACGERWSDPVEDGPLRVAIEDYLGAGAIIAGLDCSKSPEARLCASAFMAHRDDIGTMIRECGSGVELRERGFERDVLHAARLDVYDTVPVMRGERFVGKYEV